jgi:hypothetical protein
MPFSISRTLSPFFHPSICLGVLKVAFPSRGYAPWVSLPTLRVQPKAPWQHVSSADALGLCPSELSSFQKIRCALPTRRSALALRSLCLCFSGFIPSEKQDFHSVLLTQYGRPMALLGFLAFQTLSLFKPAKKASPFFCYPLSLTSDQLSRAVLCWLSGP